MRTVLRRTLVAAGQLKELGAGERVPLVAPPEVRIPRGSPKVQGAT